ISHVKVRSMTIRITSLIRVLLGLAWFWLGEQRNSTITALADLAENIHDLSIDALFVGANIDHGVALLCAQRHKSRHETLFAHLFVADVKRAISGERDDHRFPRLAYACGRSMR